MFVFHSTTHASAWKLFPPAPSPTRINRRTAFHSASNGADDTPGVPFRRGLLSLLKSAVHNEVLSRTFPSVTSCGRARQAQNGTPYDDKGLSPASITNDCSGQDVNHYITSVLLFHTFLPGAANSSTYPSHCSGALFSLRALGLTFTLPLPTQTIPRVQGRLVRASQRAAVNG